MSELKSGEARPRINLVISSMALLVGGGVGALLVFLYVCHKSVPLLTNPNDSPVTVRGGSIEITNPSGAWAQSGVAGKYTEFVETSSINNSSIYLYGIHADDTTPWGNTVQPIDNTQKWNWKIVVQDRDGLGNEAGPGQIQICSSPGSPSSGCSDPMGTIPAGVKSYMTYFYVSSNFCTQTADLFAEMNRETQFLHDPTGDSDPNKCKTNPRTIRDHIGLIQVTIGTNTEKYHCVLGQCTVSIGWPELF